MADEKKDPPIEPVEFLNGVKVVDFGDIRVSRGLSRRPYNACKHLNMVYSAAERRIWCQDCERDVEPFDAFTAVAENNHEVVSKLARRERIVAEAEAHKLHLIAAKVMERAWRDKSMVPQCPHCRKGLFAEYFRTDPAMIHRDWALAQLKKK